MGKYIDIETVKVIAHDYLYVQQEEDAFMSEIGEASTSDVAPVRHGTWVTWAGSLGKCSVCGYEYTDLIECNAFCGNCGARMDADE